MPNPNELARLYEELEQLRKALTELVRLKDIKESDPEQHDRLKDAAWVAAREALKAGE